MPPIRRILFLITDLKVGGTPTVVRELAVRLREPGRVETAVACLAEWGPVADQLRAAGVPVTALGARSALMLPVVRRRLIRLVRDGGFDTVFSFLVHANAVAAWSAKRCPGVRFFQSIQTTQDRPAWHWWLQGRVHRAAERVVAPSPSVVDAGRWKSRIPEEKFVVIPNAIDPGDFADVGPAPDATPFPIGFLGRLDPVKRVTDLVDAVGRLDGLVHLHVFGDGPERGRVERQVARSNLARSVTMHGTCGRPQDALRRIGLLVLPSEAEGFGLVLIEAMAAGVPIVASRVPGIRDVVKGGTGILVYPRHPEALAKAIRAVVGKPTLRARLAARGKEKVAREYAWPAVLAQYRELLGLA